MTGQRFTVTTATNGKQVLDVEAANELLQGKDAPAVVEWACSVFGDRLAMTSSFGVQAAVMLHLVTQVIPDIPVVFIDTGFHFPETYQFADQLANRLKLNLKIYQSPMSAARMVALHGPLWDQGEEGLIKYDELRKVEPMQQALNELDVHAWLAGLRRSQTDFRAKLRFVESQANVAKVHPIINWTTKDVHEYLKKHDLPYHPLHEKGYASIGDWHSTSPISEGQDERAGRFKGLKQECGIHLPTTKAEDQSRESSGL